MFEGVEDNKHLLGSSAATLSPAPTAAYRGASGASAGNGGGFGEEESLPPKRVTSLKPLLERPRPTVPATLAIVSRTFAHWAKNSVCASLRVVDIAGEYIRSAQHVKIFEMFLSLSCGILRFDFRLFGFFGSSGLGFRIWSLGLRVQGLGLRGLGWFWVGN